jgi:hypothetical protein
MSSFTCHMSHVYRYVTCHICHCHRLTDSHGRTHGLQALTPGIIHREVLLSTRSAESRSCSRSVFGIFGISGSVRNQGCSCDAVERQQWEPHENFWPVCGHVAASLRTAKRFAASRAVKAASEGLAIPCC